MDENVLSGGDSLRLKIHYLTPFLRPYSFGRVIGFDSVRRVSTWFLFDSDEGNFFARERRRLSSVVTAPGTRYAARACLFVYEVRFFFSLSLSLFCLFKLGGPIRPLPRTTIHSISRSMERAKERVAAATRRRRGRRGHRRWIGPLSSLNRSDHRLDPTTHKVLSFVASVFFCLFFRRPNRSTSILSSFLRNASLAPFSLVRNRLSLSNQANTIDFGWSSVASSDEWSTITAEVKISTNFYQF